MVSYGPSVCPRPYICPPYRNSMVRTIADRSWFFSGQGQTGRPPGRPFSQRLFRSREHPAAGRWSKYVIFNIIIHVRCYKESKAKQKDPTSREDWNLPGSTAPQRNDSVSSPSMRSHAAPPTPPCVSRTNIESLALLSGVASEMAKISGQYGKRKASKEDGLGTTTSKKARPNGHLQSHAETTEDDEHIQQPILPNVSVIQDWHAVIGDKHSGNRTTIATKIFKEVKQWYKQNKVNYRGQSRQSDLLNDAMTMYFRLVSEVFSQDFPTEES